MREPFDRERFNSSGRRTQGSSVPALSATSAASSLKSRNTCFIDHYRRGFEGQTVYAWRGPYKGKLAVILRTSGALSRVSLESAIQGNSVLDVPSDCLVACVPRFFSMAPADRNTRKCACVVAPGVALPWSKEAIENISILFNRSIPDIASRPSPMGSLPSIPSVRVERRRTPPPGAFTDFNFQLENVEPSLHGMLIFGWGCFMADDPRP